jgi:hypothetical protein
LVLSCVIRALTPSPFSSTFFKDLGRGAAAMSSRVVLPISGDSVKGVWLKGRISKGSLIAAEIAAIPEVAAVGVPV